MKRTIFSCLPKKRTQLALAIASFLFIAALALSASAWLTPYLFAAATSRAAQSPRSQRRQGPVQLVRFTLFDVGIRPSVARARAGRIIVSLEDRSGVVSGLGIERAIGGANVHVGQVRRSPDYRRGKLEMQLEPGRYRVFDSSQPGNRALLIVEP